jgi:hypothetical protein
MFLLKRLSLATSLSLFLSFMLVASCFGQSSSVFAPIWMKTGAYAEYWFDEGFRVRSDGTFGAYANGTYRWECIALTGTLAKFNLTLSFNEEDSITVLSGETMVDTLNRSVYGLDGTLHGTTQFWLESNPNDGEKFVIWDLPPNKVDGLVNVGGGYYITPQGKQNCYEITGNGTINNKTAIFNTFYDLSTGLMISGILWHEGSLSALNTHIISGMDLSDTNIDLGPSRDSFDLGAFLPPALICIAVVLIFVTIYRRQRKKT